MIKVSTFLSQTDYGISAIPLFGKADKEFEKVASSGLLPEVVTYVAALRPRADAQYVLVNALGAGEYYGSNVNGDHFPEAALIHKPDGWACNPLLDKPRSADWAYGFPTFYNAHPFQHHRNKDPSRAYGEIELATWNDAMKRVELVIRVDRDKCEKFGGIGVWDKLKAGQYPDVSMGSKVPFDTSSITLDWDLYRKAQATYDPKKHKHPGQAVLEFHKKLKGENGKGIPGVSITRNDYDEWTKNQMNRILPDGRKVFVYNDYPRFFDISFVFIGADKTAKVMVLISRSAQSATPSAFAAEKLGYSELEYPLEKAASAEQEPVVDTADDILKQAFGVKSAATKKGEISKEVKPQWDNAALPLMTNGEPDLPQWALEALGKHPLQKALSTSAGMGIVLRPREFQELMLKDMGLGPLSDKLKDNDVVFPKSGGSTPMGLGSSQIAPALARMLLPLLESRSALGPFVERRITICIASKPKDAKDGSSVLPELLSKIGAAYNGYRKELMEVVASAQDILPQAVPALEEEHKLASVEIDSIFTPFSYTYLTGAFWNELPAVSDVGRKPNV